LAIYEAALLTQAMQDLISHGGASSKELHAQALRDGYVPIREYGLHKVMQGLTTIEEVISVTAGDIGGSE
jgi:type II secretory ATPase GspE/PulE/Tfp pilus assembly ATPase PilB-like protein